jgi:hypothetical protein
MEKRNTKWSKYVPIGPGGGARPCNTSSNGKGTPKVTTPGKMLIKFMLPYSSNFITRPSLQLT